MKKVLYSDIATGVRQPYTKVTHEWYNSMIIEATNALAKGIVGNNNTDYIALFGCENSDSPNADISAGAIYQNGIIYLVPAYVNASITNTIVGTLSTTYSASDPVLFSDGNSRYVHEIKTIEFTDAASGSGLFDYADLIRNKGTIRSYIEIGDWNMDTTANISVDISNLGLDFTKLINVNAIIISDSGARIPINKNTSGVVDGNIETVGSGAVLLERTTGGYFDSSIFDSTSFNRGYIYLETFV